MITVQQFDKYNGKDVHIYELSNEFIKVGITDFGAAIQYLKIATDKGECDICLGFNRVKDYIESGTYCGATIGRVGNRIKSGEFTLNGKEYRLTINDGKNHLHGGVLGYDKQFFKVTADGDNLVMSYLDKDKSQGYDGNLQFSVIFSLNGMSLNINYKAISDCDTPFNPTCHAYFNMNGSGDIYDNLLRIYARNYTPVDEELIPTGKLAEVKNTPFDFTEFKAIGQDISAQDEQLKNGGGYDHSYALEGEHAATAYGKLSGIKMDVFTDMPGVQFYSGNFVKGNGKNGELKPRQGFCLEPQYFPNAVNEKSFKSPIIKAGECVSHYIRYDFQIDKI